MPSPGTTRASPSTTWGTIQKRSWPSTGRSRSTRQIANIWNARGIVLKALGNDTAAIEAYDRAIDLNPRDAYPWNNRGNALAEQGNFTAAIQAYDRAIELDPAYASPWNGKGHALENQGNYSAAIDSYDRAVALDPQSVEAKQNHERAVAKAQGSQNAAPSPTTMMAGEPVPFMNLLALTIGAVGLAGVSRVRRV